MEAGQIRVCCANLTSKVFGTSCNVTYSLLAMPNSEECSACGVETTELSGFFDVAAAVDSSTMLQPAVINGSF